MALRSASIIALPLLMAAPALAQQQQDNAASPVFNLPRAGQPQADPNRQGPELDVYRGAPVQPAPSPVPVPTITPPPPIIAAPQPSREAQPPAEPQRPAARPTPQPAPGQTPPVQENVPEETQPSTPSPPAAAPEPETTAPITPVQPAPEQQQETSYWPWIAAAFALLAGAIGAMRLLRRKQPAADETNEAVADEKAKGSPPAAPPPPVPSPRPAARPAPPPQTGSRPWIDLSMDVRSARLSLMGVTIGYELTLHNRGDRAAEDILVRSLIANADSDQQASLQQFFAGTAGLPTHSVVSIAPGESHRLKGELRLLPDQIRPVQMEGRTLLIPVAAFDAQYRWTRDQGDAGIGRTGQAFIIGQEKSPPAERLSPFRTDLGPRQYRMPGSRATTLNLAS